MGPRVKHTIGALLGGLFAFGASVSLHDSSPAPSASPDAKPNLVLELTFSLAQADSKRRKRNRKRKAAAAEAEKKRIEDADKNIRGIRRATLPVDCVYDDNASRTNSTDTYLCGGIYYQRYEENGIAGYEGYAVGMDRGEISRVKALRANEQKKRKAAAAKKKQAGRISQLPPDCAYDSWASASSPTDVYQCGAIRYRKYQEKGATGYEVFKP